MHVPVSAADSAERRGEARLLEGIRQGIEDMDTGRAVSLDEFKEHAHTKRGIKA